MGRRPRDPQTLNAALHLLAQGTATPGQIATMAGVSRQLVERWAASANINWRGAMDARLIAAWRTAMGKPPRPRRKARMRKRADRAKREWDKRHGHD